jgi:DNA-binding response OmpR family regulator
MQTAQVFVIDDDLDDLGILKHFAKKAGILDQLMFFNDAISAIAHLKQLDKQDYPSLIISDLNMPLLNGLDLLRQLKIHDLLEEVDVVILSTSPLDDHRVASTLWGAKGFIRKPATAEGYEKLMDGLKAYLRSKKVEDLLAL